MLTRFFSPKKQSLNASSSVASPLSALSGSSTYPSDVFSPKPHRFNLGASPDASIQYDSHIADIIESVFNEFTDSPTKSLPDTTLLDQISRHVKQALQNSRTDKALFSRFKALDKKIFHLKQSIKNKGISRHDAETEKALARLTVRPFQSGVPHVLGLLSDPCDQQVTWTTNSPSRPGFFHSVKEDHKDKLHKPHTTCVRKDRAPQHESAGYSAK